MNYHRSYNYSKLFSNIIGSTLCLIGVLLSLYVSVWICIVGGIMGIVAGVNCDPMNSIMILIGVVKCLTAGLFGSIIFWIFFIFGFGIVKNKNKK